jgi:predicted molibdopterin-dependent oxidoreductase YjgC
MKIIQTVCPRDCYSTCSLEAQIDDNGRLVKLSGSSENPVTRGFTCIRSPNDEYIDWHVSEVFHGPMREK